MFARESLQVVALPPSVATSVFFGCLIFGWPLLIVFGLIFNRIRRLQRQNINSYEGRFRREYAALVFWTAAITMTVKFVGFTAIDIARCARGVIQESYELGTSFHLDPCYWTLAHWP